MCMHIYNADLTLNETDKKAEVYRVLDGDAVKKSMSGIESQCGKDVGPKRRRVKTHY